MPSKSRFASALFISAIFVFSGCEKKYDYISKDVNLTIKDDKTEELVERSMDYWEAMSKGEYDRTYDYELPYLNFLKDRSWYIEFKTGSRTQYTVNLKRVTYDARDEDIAKITTFVDLGHTSYTFEDPWYNINGTWYHFYEQSLLPKRFK